MLAPIHLKNALLMAKRFHSICCSHVSLFSLSDFCFVIVNFVLVLKATKNSFLKGSLTLRKGKENRRVLSNTSIIVLSRKNVVILIRFHSFIHIVQVDS